MPSDWVELAGTQSADEALGVIRGALDAVDAFDVPLSLLEVIRRVVAAKMGFDLSGGPGLVLVGWSSEPHHVQAVGMLLAAMAGPAKSVPVGAQGEETE